MQIPKKGRYQCRYPKKRAIPMQIPKKKGDTNADTQKKKDDTNADTQKKGRYPKKGRYQCRYPKKADTNADTQKRPIPMPIPILRRTTN